MSNRNNVGGSSNSPANEPDIWNAEHFNKSVRAYPNDALVFVNRAISYSRLNRIEDAIAECNIALAMDPNCCEAHHTLGNIYYSLRQLEDSLVEFEEAVRLNPNNAQYRDHLQDARDRYTAYLAKKPKRSHDDSDAASEPPIKRRRLVDRPSRGIVRGLLQWIRQQASRMNFLHRGWLRVFLPSTTCSLFW